MRRQKQIVSLLAFLLPFLLYSCIDDFRQEAYDKLINLKTSHIKFIETFTQKEGDEFDDKKFKQEVEKINYNFDETLILSKSLNDDLRTDSFQKLKETFHADVDNIKTKRRMLTAEEAETLIGTTTTAYDSAIKGECARSNAPPNCK